MIRRRMLSTLLAATLGCSTTTLSGVVIDANNQPVNGVVVRTDDSPDCATETKGTGVFQLECPPGDWSLRFEHSAYLSAVRSAQVASGDDATLTPTILRAIPQKTGLHVLVDNRFELLPATTLTRTTRTEGAAKERAFCIDSDALEPTPAARSGLITMIATDPSSWRAFRMDENGCAYRDAKTADGHWVIEHQDRPDLRTNREQRGVWLTTWDATSGDYFLADWAGFFVPLKTDPERYSGRWLRVD